MSLQLSLLPLPQAGASVTYCLRKMSLEESAGQSHHLRMKRKPSGRRDSSVRARVHTKPHFLQHQEPKQGEDSSLGLHPTDVTLVRVHPIQHGRWKLLSDTRERTGTRLLTRRRPTTKARMQGPVSEWELGTEMDPAIQCSVSGLAS